MTKLWRLIGTGAVAMALLTGCTDVVEGVAERAPNETPDDVPPLRESQLKGVLLSVDELNDIFGSSGMEMVSDVDELSDNSSFVSDPECLGAVYGAEQEVYGTGWEAVRRQIVREPGADNNEYWSEQTVVLYPSANEARGFVDESEPTWADCSASAVAIDDSDDEGYIWEIGDLAVDGDLLTQIVTQEDADGWDCQHTLTSVSNVVVETIGCAVGVADQGAAMSAVIVDNIVSSAK